MLRKLAVLANASRAGLRGALKLKGRGPFWPGKLYAREQRATSSVEGSPVYRKVSAGDQSSSSSVGASVGVAAREGSVELLEISKVPVLFIKESVLLAVSTKTADVKSGVSCALSRNGSRIRIQTQGILDSTTLQCPYVKPP